jgi:hypothetical protein
MNQLSRAWLRAVLAAKNAALTFRVHFCLAAMWMLLVIPTWYLWRTSLFWIAFISLYANFVSHWGAGQAALAQLVAGRAEIVAGEARTEAVRVAELLATQSLREFHCAAEQMTRIEKAVTGDAPPG